MNTELDKTIIDSLESPLMHLIRNCIDHGIEPPDVRKMRGKPKTGTIKLIARRSAAHVHIIVSDDGEGLSKDAIREKAIQKGIALKEEALSDSEIYEYIFMPGFSTALNLTEVSGRGVGMDVVKQTILNLRGNIEIETKAGEGTSFIIHLPLNLSILDTMLLKSDGMYYAVPLSAINKCTEILSDVLEQRNNNHIVVDGQLTTFFILKENLAIQKHKRFHKIEDENKQADKKKKVVIVKHNDKKTALIVDKVIGEHQAVLKPLGQYFRKQKYISGASQLASGEIALVLDSAKLVEYS